MKIIGVVLCVCIVIFFLALFKSSKKADIHMNKIRRDNKKK